MTRILVIRRDNIGDLVCATPLLSALRRRYPDAHLAVLANTYNAPVLEGNPDVDAVHSYTKLKHRRHGESWAGTLARTLKLLLALRRQRFDYVVLARSGFDRHGLAWARRIAPRHIVGFAPPEEPAARAIDMPVAPLAYGELHEAEVMMTLAARLGASEKAGPLRACADANAVQQWRAKLPLLGNKHHPWVAFHVSARERGRVWPEAHCARLVRQLVARHGVGVVLLWAPGAADDPRHPGDDARAAAIVRQAGESAGLVPARTESLRDLAAVLSLCDAFIGPDGGTLHIAAGLRLPIVALFENNAYKKRHWYPWQVPHAMVCPKTRDVADISVEQVEEAWVALSQQLKAGAAAVSP